MSLGSLLRPAVKPFTLRATGAGVEYINILPGEFANCLSVYLSYNSISSLKNIVQFRRMTTLLMEYNNIQYIEDLEPLSKLRDLKVLNIEGNPVCRLPMWDVHVVVLCQKLRVLNGVRVSKLFSKPYSRKELAEFVELEARFHDALWRCKFISRALELKLGSTGMEWAKAVQIAKESLFGDPEQLLKNRRKVREKAAGSSDVDAYFGLLRQ